MRGRDGAVEMGVGDSDEMGSTVEGEEKNNCGSISMPLTELSESHLSIHHHYE